MAFPSDFFMDPCPSHLSETLTVASVGHTQAPPDAQSRNLCTRTLNQQATVSGGAFVYEQIKANKKYAQKYTYIYIYIYICICIYIYIYIYI